MINTTTGTKLPAIKTQKAAVDTENHLESLYVLFKL